MITVSVLSDIVGNLPWPFPRCIATGQKPRSSFAVATPHHDKMIAMPEGRPAASKDKSIVGKDKYKKPDESLSKMFRPCVWVNM